MRFGGLAVAKWRVGRGWVGGVVLGTFSITAFKVFALHHLAIGLVSIAVIIRCFKSSYSLLRFSTRLLAPIAINFGKILYPRFLASSKALCNGVSRPLLTFLLAVLSFFSKDETVD
jgi:hypothetical protein